MSQSWQYSWLHTPRPPPSNLIFWTPVPGGKWKPNALQLRSIFHLESHPRKVPWPFGHPSGFEKHGKPHSPWHKMGNLSRQKTAMVLQVTYFRYCFLHTFCCDKQTVQRVREMLEV